MTWGRDACARCSMAVADRRYAAQIRDLDGHVHSFDDLGCALAWWDRELGPDADVSEIWVRDRSGEGWLDARTARFTTGDRTPMDYGFGAVPADGEGLGLAEVRLAVRMREGERRQR